MILFGVIFLMNNNNNNNKTPRTVSDKTLVIISIKFNEVSIWLVLGNSKLEHNRQRVEFINEKFSKCVERIRS